MEQEPTLRISQVIQVLKEIFEKYGDVPLYKRINEDELPLPGDKAVHWIEYIDAFGTESGELSDELCPPMVRID